MDSEAVEQAVERFLAGGDPGDVVGQGRKPRACPVWCGVRHAFAPWWSQVEPTYLLVEQTSDGQAFVVIHHTPRVSRFVAAVDALGGGAVTRDVARRLWAESEQTA